MEKTFLLLACGVGTFLLAGCYYLKQGSALLKYQCGARPISELLADPSIPPHTRDFLNAVEDIRHFAVEKIGLKKTKNYSRFVRTERDYIADNVCAANADTFSQYFWRYPFLGAMPYKGFFDRPAAEKEARRMAEKGYDVHIGRITGFSTLGILRDPVYSFMEDYGPYSLSNLIFHELTHATVFIKGQTQFNEEAATFIALEGSLLYISEKYGTGSEEYTRTVLLSEDEETCRTLIASLYRRLDSIYMNERSPAARIRLKCSSIADFRHFVTSKYDSLFKTKSYADLASDTINNATLMMAMTYSRDLSLFCTLHRKCGNDLKKTVSALKQLEAMAGDPKSNIREILLKK